jgi:hypothetical protein
MENMVRFIGDCHGHFEPYKRIIRACETSVQVGDMGIGFRRSDGYRDGEEYSNPPHYAMVKGNHRFIRGNHDNPGSCRRHSQWIPDGTIEGNTMYIGGAVSIDKAFRREGYSWWADEECSMNELYAMVDKYVEAKPEIMVTHEAPQEVAETMVNIKENRKLDPQWSSRTRQAFQSMWSCHSPKLWIYGHWHMHFMHKLRDTLFICLPELNYIDVNKKDLTLILPWE